MSTFSIVYGFEKAQNNLKIINENMRAAGLLGANESWAIPIPLIGQIPVPLIDTEDNLPKPEHINNKWFWRNPDAEYMEGTFDILYTVANPPNESTEALIKKYSIYNYLNGEKLTIHKDFSYFPGTIDYKRDVVNALYADYSSAIFVGGNLLELIYYGEYDDLTGVYSVPIMRFSAAYTVFDDATYNSSKTLKVQTETRNWYYTDGTLDLVNSRVDVKPYSHVTNRRKAGQRRRSNIESIAGEDMVKLIMATDDDFSVANQLAAENTVLIFADDNHNEISAFIRVGKDKMVQTINTAPIGIYPWLGLVVPATFNHPVLGNNIPIAVLLPTATIGDTAREHMEKLFRGDI